MEEAIPGRGIAIVKALERGQVHLVKGQKEVSAAWRALKAKDRSRGGHIGRQGSQNMEI